MADDRGSQMQAVVISLLVVAMVSIAARCYTRAVLLKQFFLEDWVALTTLLTYGAYSAAALVSIHYGLGKHVEDVNPQDRPVAIMWRWIATNLYIVVSGLTKLVVAMFLLRVSTPLHWQRTVLWIIIVVNTLYTIFYAALNINSCRPVEYEWTRYSLTPESGNCNDVLVGTIPTYISAFLNVLFDWTLAILPATLLWKLQMNIQVKVSAWGILALGSIASVATIVRIPYAQDFLDNPDYLYNFTELGIWSTVEIGVAIIASSLATLKPLFRQLKLFAPASYHVSGAQRRSGRGSELVVIAPDEARRQSKGLSALRRSGQQELQGGESDSERELGTLSPPRRHFSEV